MTIIAARGLLCAKPHCKSRGDIPPVVGDLAEQRFELVASARRKVDDARGALAPGPFQREDAVEQRGAERAGKVIASHAPVEAGLAHRTAHVTDLFEIDA